MEFLTDLISDLKTRLKNRFIGPFIISLLILNWESIALFWLSTDSAINRVNRAKEHLSPNTIWLAASLAVLYSITSPILSLGILLIQRTFLEIEKKISLEISLIRESYSDEIKFSAALKRKERWIEFKVAKEFLEQIYGLISPLAFKSVSDNYQDFLKNAQDRMPRKLTKDMIDRTNDKEIKSILKELSLIFKNPDNTNMDEIHALAYRLQVKLEKMRINFVHEGEEIGLKNWQ